MVRVGVGSRRDRFVLCDGGSEQRLVVVLFDQLALPLLRGRGRGGSGIKTRGGRGAERRKGDEKGKEEREVERV